MLVNTTCFALQELDEAMKNLSRGRTRLIVARQRRTVDSADKIAFGVPRACTWARYQTGVISQALLVLYSDQSRTIQ